MLHLPYLHLLFIS
jgi:hypothetical protein